MMSLSLGGWGREAAGPGSTDTLASSFPRPLTHHPSIHRHSSAAYPAAGTVVDAVKTARIGLAGWSSG